MAFLLACCKSEHRCWHLDSGRDARKIWAITPAGGKAQCWLKRGRKFSIPVLGLWLRVGHPLYLRVRAKSSEELGELDEGRLKHPNPVAHSRVALPSTRALVPSGQDAQVSMLALGSSHCLSLVFISQNLGLAPRICQQHPDSALPAGCLPEQSAGVHFFRETLQKPHFFLSSQRQK